MKRREVKGKTLPCPFCGGETVMNILPDRILIDHVFDEDKENECPLDIGVIIYGDDGEYTLDEEFVLKKWNTREKLKCLECERIYAEFDRYLSELQDETAVLSGRLIGTVRCELIRIVNNNDHICRPLRGTYEFLMTGGPDDYAALPVGAKDLHEALQILLEEYSGFINLWNSKIVSVTYSEGK